MSIFRLPITNIFFTLSRLPSFSYRNIFPKQFSYTLITHTFPLFVNKFCILCILHLLLHLFFVHYAHMPFLKTKKTLQTISLQNDLQHLIPPFPKPYPPSSYLMQFSNGKPAGQQCRMDGRQTDRAQETAHSIVSSLCEKSAISLTEC